MNASRVEVLSHAVEYANSSYSTALEISELRHEVSNDQVKLFWQTSHINSISLYYIAPEPGLEVGIPRGME